MIVIFDADKILNENRARATKENPATCNPGLCCGDGRAFHIADGLWEVRNVKTGDWFVYHDETDQTLVVRGEVAIGHQWDW